MFRLVRCAMVLDKSAKSTKLAITRDMFSSDIKRSSHVSNVLICSFPTIVSEKAHSTTLKLSKMTDITFTIPNTTIITCKNHILNRMWMNVYISKLAMYCLFHIHIIKSILQKIIWLIDKSGEIMWVMVADTIDHPNTHKMEQMWKSVQNSSPHLYYTVLNRVWYRENNSH